MLPMDVDAILRAHGAEDLALSYQKDCYALSLLGHVIGGGRPISVLKKGPFARLFEKPLVKRALSFAANGVLTPACLERALPEERELFRVTLARWGGKTPREWKLRYYQTSRPGENLVLQLNFPAAHDRAYRHLLRPGNYHPFVMSRHPVRRGELFTLAWVRLDVDERTNEVLIEEVQSDWVKDVDWYRKNVESDLAQGELADVRLSSSFHGSASEFFVYAEKIVGPYARLWQECALALALDFVYSRLGARRVFFHTYQGGLFMKRLEGAVKPPRSVYTTLPESFCFTRTKTPPRMFERDGRLRRGVEWFLLELV